MLQFVGLDAHQPLSNVCTVISEFVFSSLKLELLLWGSSSQRRLFSSFFIDFWLERLSGLELFWLIPLMRLILTSFLQRTVAIRTDRRLLLCWRSMFEIISYLICLFKALGGFLR